MATLKELREKAKAYELKGYSKLNKAQLEELISKYDQAAQEATPETPDTQEISAQPKTDAPVSIDYVAIVNADLNSGKGKIENMEISDQIINELEKLSDDALREFAKSEMMDAIDANLSIGGCLTNRLKKLLAGETIPSGYRKVVRNEFGGGCVEFGGGCVVDVPLDTPMVRAFHEQYNLQATAQPEATPEISTTDNSNPDDNPDPTPPSNGGNTPEHSEPAPADHQPAPAETKPATRKPRNAKKLDDSRQFCFDDTKTPATVQPAKPKTHRPRKPEPEHQVHKTSFTTEEISACTTREQLTELFRQAANREVLIRVFREYGIVYAGLEFCTKEKLAEYLAGELLMLRKVKPLRRKFGLFERMAGALKRKSEEIALSLSVATLAGIIGLFLTV